MLSIPEKINNIAAEYKISSTTLYNLAYNESRLDPRAVSPTGDYGIVQLNLKAPPVLEKGQAPITEELAFNTTFALRFAAKAISLNRQSAWTVCNCYSYVRARVPSFPPQSQLAPTTGAYGATKVAIFDYDGVPHYGIVVSSDSTGFIVDEANYRPCVVGTRHVDWGDAHLVGFWSK